MKGKNHLRSRMALLTALCVLGSTYGLGATGFAEKAQESERITLGSDLSIGNQQETAEETEAEKEISGAIEKIPTQEASEALTIPDITKVAQTAMPAIVAITNQGVETIDYFGMEYKMDSETSGSGIIIGKNDTELLIATNHHVVNGAKNLTVCFSVDTEDENDKLVKAQVKGTDSSLDLAVVAVKLSDISKEAADKIGIIQMGDSDNVEVGEWAIAIGNALGYGQSVTFGIISALDREIELSSDHGVISNRMLQTDAAINFGNSGGALLNSKGELIGINSAKAAETGVEGMGYAIPINSAKSVIEDLMSQTTREKVDDDKAGALGLEPVDVSDEARQLYNIPSGAFVYKIVEGSAAQKAGIREGDIIVKLDKTVINSKAELFERMKYYEAGENVEVTVKRNGDNGYEEKVIEVILGRKADLKDSSASQNQGQRNLENQDNNQNPYAQDQRDQDYEQWYNGNSLDPDFGGNGSIQDWFRFFGF